jgi:hypothetical protein
MRIAKGAVHDPLLAVDGDVEIRGGRLAIPVDGVPLDHNVRAGIAVRLPIRRDVLGDAIPTFVKAGLVRQR